MLLILRQQVSCLAENMLHATLADLLYRDVTSFSENAKVTFL